MIFRFNELFSFIKNRFSQEESTDTHFSVGTQIATQHQRNDIVDFLQCVMFNFAKYEFKFILDYMLFMDFRSVIKPFAYVHIDRT